MNKNIRRVHSNLVGHDNPLGIYPAPVVPIVKLGNSLVAVYASNSNYEIARLPKGVKFVRHAHRVKRSLEAFDYRKHRLFAFGEDVVEFYPSRSEVKYLTDLLNRRSVKRESPFFRLSIARGTENPELVVNEIASCLTSLENSPRGFIDLWYETQLKDTSLKLISALPANWRLLLNQFKNVESTSSFHRGVEVIRQAKPKYHPEYHPASVYQSATLSRAARVQIETTKKRTSRFTLVKELANRCRLTKGEVTKLFRELVLIGTYELNTYAAFTVPYVGTIFIRRVFGKSKRSSETKHRTSHIFVLQPSRKMTAAIRQRKIHSRKVTRLRPSKQIK